MVHFMGLEMVVIGFDHRYLWLGVWSSTGTWWWEWVGKLSFIGADYLPIVYMGIWNIVNKCSRYIEQPTTHNPQCMYFWNQLKYPEKLYGDMEDYYLSIHSSDVVLRHHFIIIQKESVNYTIMWHRRAIWVFSGPTLLNIGPPLWYQLEAARITTQTKWRAILTISAHHFATKTKWRADNTQ